MRHAGEWPAAGSAAGPKAVPARLRSPERVKTFEEALETWPSGERTQQTQSQRYRPKGVFASKDWPPQRAFSLHISLSVYIFVSFKLPSSH